MARQATTWRTCIDFGTAGSKASTCSVWDKSDQLLRHVHPLQVGNVCGEPNPYVAESALLFDRGQVFFGWNARKRANAEPSDAEILHSFKTFLAAADLKAALDLKLRRTIDRSGKFRQRDALTLFIAYLIRITERAMSADRQLPAEAADNLRRYAYPTWRTGAEANALLGQIFDHAAGIADALGDDMIAPTGIAADAALNALQQIPVVDGRARIEAGVYEAQAAAECHFAYTRGLPHHVIVFDMGAGTTDITSFELTETGDAHFMREIANSRRTILLACDEVDKLLLSHILEKAKLPQSASAKLWRQLALNRRQLKEQLFATGSAEVHWEGRRVGIKLADFNRDRHFASFRAALQTNFKHCLTQVEHRAAAAGQNEVGIVLAGGGANLPFVQRMAASARPNVRGIKRLVLQPLVPSWAQDSSFDHLAPIFPQVSISVGGAVARVQPADVNF